MNKVLKALANLLPYKKISGLFKERKIHREIAEFKPYLIKRRFEGDEFDFLIADKVSKYWYDQQVVANTFELQFIKRHLISPGDVVFDCGAYHGYTTLLFAKWAGDKGKVHAFEASRHNFEALQKNIEANKLPNVFAYHKAVGKAEGKVNLSPDYSANILAGGNKNLVDVVPLDNYKDENPDFIKIDVEGFEGEVLKGCPEILRKKPKLMIEVHTDWLAQYGTSIKEILNLIGLDRYEIWVQWADDAEPKKYQNKPILQRVHLFAMPKK